MSNIYIVLEYWLTESDWDSLHDMQSYSTLHQDELYNESPQKSGPNMFAFTTKELADKHVVMLTEAYSLHVKNAEKHDVMECEDNINCSLCCTRQNEKTYSYVIREVNLIEHEEINHVYS